jgi:hypothetical protein
MKIAVIWFVAPCGSCKNRRFGGTCHLHLQGRKNPRAKKSVSTQLTDMLPHSRRRHSLCKLTSLIHTKPHSTAELKSVTSRYRFKYQKNNFALMGERPSRKIVRFVSFPSCARVYTQTFETVFSYLTAEMTHSILRGRKLYLSLQPVAYARCYLFACTD